MKGRLISRSMGNELVAFCLERLRETKNESQNGNSTVTMGQQNKSSQLRD
jgi:hypothetical protein